MTSTRPPSPDPRSLPPLLSPAALSNDPSASPLLPDNVSLVGRARTASGQQSSKVIAGLQETVIELRAEVDRARHELRAERDARADEKAKLLALLESKGRDTLELSALRAASSRKERQMAELHHQSSVASDELDELRVEHAAALEALDDLRQTSQQSQDRIALAEQQYSVLQASFASLQSSFAQRLNKTLDAVRESKSVAEEGLAQATARKGASERERAAALAIKAAVMQERHDLDDRFLDAWGVELNRLKEDVRDAGEADARVVGDVDAMNRELGRLRRLIAQARRPGKGNASPLDELDAAVLPTPPISGSISLASAFELDDEA